MLRRRRLILHRFSVHQVRIHGRSSVEPGLDLTMFRSQIETLPQSHRCLFPHIIPILTLSSFVVTLEIIFEMIQYDIRIELSTGRFEKSQISFAGYRE
ncbi:hypothetical protein AVEN_257026-1 [Araneus ventricosus]|uniref:Uncharacterized protein n=1 Tax=Araneus ventricosus TaxID=182803 RepID=A0A4Y2T4G4_ARAVE|nr:hypothetical protein AVEN_257026-1 [Araneus ventricosus]